jgi:hypothetical protein
MTICIGRPIIEALARDGAWTSESGESAVAASDLFGRDPYVEVERLRGLLLDACKVFDHYDLPEHSLHYRRKLGPPTAYAEAKAEVNAGWPSADPA